MASQLCPRAKPLLEKVAKEAADDAKAKLEAAGATVTGQIPKTPGPLLRVPGFSRAQPALCAGAFMHVRWCCGTSGGTRVAA